MAMTITQARFVENEKRRKAFMDEFDDSLKAVALEVGIDEYFQDDDGVVYKIVEPAGRWVKFEKVSYLRTKRDDERQGTLSAKEAKEAGFDAK